MAIVIAGGVVLGLPSPAAARPPRDYNAQVVLTGHVDVARDQHVGDVVIVNGPASVDGEVHGSLVVFNGNASVTGTVTEDVIVFNGTLTIARSARVGGDVVSRETPSVAPGATIRGSVRRLRSGEWVRSLSFLTRFVVWLAVSLSSLALGLLLILIGPRAIDAVGEAARASTGAAIGWGFLVFFGLPIGAIVALITLVGIPMGVGVLLALALLYSIGYVASAWVVGRLISRSAGRVVTFLIGIGVLRAVALVPVLGGITWFLGAVFGLGALAVAAWRARAGGMAVPPPPPPVEAPA